MRVPGQCGYEAKTLELRKGKPKSCCTIRGHEIWTNCRIVQECVFSDSDLQMGLFEIVDDEWEDEE